MTPSPPQRLLLAIIAVIDRFPRLATLLRRLHFQVREPYRVLMRRLTEARRPPAPRPADAKEQFRRAAAAQLAAFLDRGQGLSLPSSAAPRVSIILVLYNQAELTLGCLLSLSQERDIPYETIIVDNCSQDDTPRLLRLLAGAKVVRNRENMGFLKAVNQATLQARGRHLLLLNNDTVLPAGSLAAACARLESKEEIGAVGGKIILPDGSLQEAGSIVWRDGSCLGYGRGADPGAPEFQFVREVDYCSGAFLLIRRQLFEQLGRFDEAYAPAYYEESDFCLRLRQAGYSVVYEPKAVIQHFEFASSVVKEHAIELQRRHRDILVARHGAFLAGKENPAPARVLDARLAKPVKGHILIIDDQVPDPSLGGGFPRAVKILRLLWEFGYFITFYPLRFPDNDWQRVYAVLPEEVEVMLGAGLTGLEDFLAQRQGFYSHLLISRPHNMETISGLWQKNSALFQGLQIVYDAEALFSVREMLQEQVTGQSPADEATAQARIDSELDLSAIAHQVLTVTANEAAHFRRRVRAQVHVLGHAMTAQPTPAPFATRQGLLFVGAMLKNHYPNADSMFWFVREVWPHLQRLLPDLTLTIVGECQSTRIPALASTHIHVLGRQDDLGHFYDNARIFIVPTRFAAGIPMKAHEAASFGLPMVVSPLIASQLGWQHEQELLIGDSALSFAQQIARLHEDEGLWQVLRRQALARIETDCSPAAFVATLGQVFP